MFLKICPVCHKYPIDPGESDCGCVAEEKQRNSRWDRMIAVGECGQMELNLEVGNERNSSNSYGGI